MPVGQAWMCLYFCWCSEALFSAFRYARMCLFLEAGCVWFWEYREGQFSLALFQRAESFGSPGMTWTSLDTGKRGKGTPSLSGTTRHLS